MRSFQGLNTWASFACSIPELQHDINVNLLYLQNWLITNRLTLKVLKNEYMSVGLRQRIATVIQGEELVLLINGISLKKKKKRSSSKCVAVEIDEFVTWDSHITSVSKKVSSVIEDL